MWSNGSQSPRDEAETEYGERSIADAQSAEPSDNAEKNLGGNLGGDRCAELLDDTRTGRRQVSQDIARPGLRRREELPELCFDVRRIRHQAANRPIMRLVWFPDVATRHPRNRHDPTDENKSRDTQSSQGK